jgi:hypothetical protein
MQGGRVQGYMLFIVMGLVGFFGYYFYLVHHLAAHAVR